MIDVKITKTLIKQLIGKVLLRFSPTFYQIIRFRRVGPIYSRTIRLLKKTEYMREELIQAWQFRQLKNVLIHAYEKIPYYKETFRQAGLDPNDMIELADIQAFPFLTKEQYRDNIDKFISEDMTKAQLRRIYTGGTTGMPIPVYRDLSDSAREEAFTDYVYRMLDMDPFCKRVYMRGAVDDKRGRYHRIDYMGKVLFLSSNNMSDENLKLYVKLIREFEPRLLYTLPSVATVLAEYMDRTRTPPFDSLFWAFCPSENLYKFQIKLIEKVLQCRVGTFYGHSEHAVMAGRCTKSPLYHVLPQYGYTELIDEDGKPIIEEGELGEIVGTAFANSSCPFIRYRTGDYAVYTKKKCPCGRSYQMWEKIEGRGQFVAVTKNGDHVSIGPELLCTIHNRTYGRIRQFQIEQHRVGELTIRVVPSISSDVLEIQEYFKRFFAEQYPRSFNVKVERLTKRTQKHLYFIQNLNENL